MTFDSRKRLYPQNLRRIIIQLQNALWGYILSLRDFWRKYEGRPKKQLRRGGLNCFFQGTAVRTCGLGKSVQVSVCPYDSWYLTHLPVHQSEIHVLAELTSFERREILRAAVFLWITPFFEALSINDWAVISFAVTSSFDDSSTERCTFLTRLFNLVLTALLRKRPNSFCRARFNADLWLANGKHSFSE